MTRFYQMLLKRLVNRCLRLQFHSQFCQSKTDTIRSNEGQATGEKHVGRHALLQLQDQIFFFLDKKIVFDYYLRQF